MNNGALILISLLFTSSVYAQPTLQWARSYNGPDNLADDAGVVVVDDSGYVYVTGGTVGTGNNDIDYCTIKYKPNGDTSWVRIYSAIPNDSFDAVSDLKVDGTGNVIVTGYPATIKYDSFGNIAWMVVSGSFTGVKLEFDSLNNIYVGGISSLFKYTLKKYNSSGTLLWSTTYDDGGGGEPHDMVMDNFGNIIMVGEMAYNNGNSYDFFTMKFNSTGDTLWAKSFNGPGSFPPYDWANAVDVDDIGNIYVTGLSNSSVTDYLTFKYDPNGQEMWMKRYSGGIAYDIEVDKSGNVFVAGVTGLSNYTLLKYNNNGNFLWSETTSAYSFAVGVSISLDSAGNIYLGGSRIRNSWSDLLIVKYNTNGIQQWTALYPGVGNSTDEANDITLDKMGNVYATGKGYSQTSFSDFLTVKYSQPIGIVPVSSEIPKSFLLSQNFPNPFNPITIIKFDIQKLSFIKLIVNDVLGREIETLVNEQLNHGIYEVSWNASNFPSGVYFYRLFSDGIITDTKKMVLVK